MKKEYTIEDLSEAIRDERIRIYYILNYLLNKNSKPLSEGGLDAGKLIIDLEELENDLTENL